MITVRKALLGPHAIWLMNSIAVMSVFTLHAWARPTTYALNRPARFA